MRRFSNRTDAGLLLAKALLPYQGRDDVVVLALPRGGVPVAYEVARALGAPLDVFIVRKLGVPGHPELAMGALASGGIQALNQSVVQALGIVPAAIEAVAAAERREIARREKAYRSGKGPLVVAGKTVIVVDDGLATGATMRAAVQALKGLDAKRVVVAVPVAPVDTCESLKAEENEVVCLQVPQDFWAIGAWYDDFTQVSDDAVRATLSKASQDQRPAGRA